MLKQLQAESEKNLRSSRAQRRASEMNSALVRSVAVLVLLLTSATFYFGSFLPRPADTDEDSKPRWVLNLRKARPASEAANPMESGLSSAGRFVWIIDHSSTPPESAALAAACHTWLGEAIHAGHSVLLFGTGSGVQERCLEQGRGVVQVVEGRTSELEKWSKAVKLISHHNLTQTAKFVIRTSIQSVWILRHLLDYTDGLDSSQPYLWGASVVTPSSSNSASFAPFSTPEYIPPGLPKCGAALPSAGGGGVVMSVTGLLSIDLEACEALEARLPLEAPDQMLGHCLHNHGKSVKLSSSPRRIPLLNPFASKFDHSKAPSVHRQVTLDHPVTLPLMGRAGREWYWSAVLQELSLVDTWLKDGETPKLADASLSVRSMRHLALPPECDASCPEEESVHISDHIDLTAARRAAIRVVWVLDTRNEPSEKARAATLMDWQDALPETDLVISRPTGEKVSDKGSADQEEFESWSRVKGSPLVGEPDWYVRLPRDISELRIEEQLGKAVKLRSLLARIKDGVDQGGSAAAEAAGADMPPLMLGYTLFRVPSCVQMYCQDSPKCLVFPSPENEVVLSNSALERLLSFRQECEAILPTLEPSFTQVATFALSYCLRRFADTRVVGGGVGLGRNDTAFPLLRLTQRE